MYFEVGFVGRLLYVSQGLGVAEFIDPSPKSAKQMYGLRMHTRMDTLINFAVVRSRRVGCSRFVG